MKWNWGTGIVLAFAAFISFIMYFVYVANSDPRADHDMVTEEYYRKELEYQQDLDASRNLELFGGRVEVVRIPEGLGIRFPEGMDPKGLDGKMSLYRPSNKQLDFEIPIQNSDTLQLIPASRLLDGRWDIRVKWTYEGKPYLFRGRIIF